MIKKKEKENGPLGTYLFCSLYEEDMQADSGLKLFGLEHFDFFVHWGWNNYLVDLFWSNNKLQKANLFQ